MWSFWLSSQKIGMILFLLRVIGTFGKVRHYLLSLVLCVEFAKNETSNSWLLHAMSIYQPLFLFLVSIEWFYRKTWENCFWHWYFIMHRNSVMVVYSRCQQPMEWELPEISEASLRNLHVASQCYQFLPSLVFRSLIPFTDHRSLLIN